MAQFSEPWRGNAPAASPAAAGSSWTTAAAGLALLGVAAVQLWPLLSGTHSLGGDYASYYYPFVQTLARCLGEGGLPLWNPHLAAGYHHLANPQTQVFYLPGWLLALFTSQGRLSFYATELFTLAHYPLAGFFTFMYLRRVGAPALAALVGGMTFTLSGFLWAQGLHKTMVETAAWLPLVFWALEGLGQAPSLRRALLLALALALFFLGGFTPLVYICAPFIAAYALLGLVRGAGRGSHPLPRLGWLALAGALALGLVMIQLVPTLETAPLSHRQTFDLAMAAEDSFWPSYLLSALVPLAHWGGERFFSLDEVHFWVGVTPLLLAGAALCSPRRPRLWFWAATVALALLLALGQHTPLYGWLWENLPGMKVTRAPGRYALLVDLGLSVLAGLGAARLLERPQKEGLGLTLLWGLGLALGLAGGWVLWRLRWGGLDPASWGLAPDLAGQLVSALTFWGLALAALALRWLRQVATKVVVGLLAILLAAQAWSFPADMMWSPRPPQSYFAPSEAQRLAQAQLPPGRLGIELAGLGSDRHELGNLGAVLGLPTSSIFDTMTEARLWRGLASPDRRITADLLDERLLLSPRPAQELPQALHRPLELRPGEWAARDLAPLSPEPLRELGLVSQLAYAAQVPQGRVVAELLLHGERGLLTTIPLRAGVETAEWSAAKPGAGTAHAPAPVARSWPVDGGAYAGQAYVARWLLDPPQAVTRLEVRQLDPRAVLKVESLELDGRDLFTLGRRYAQVQPGLYANLLHLERARLLRSWRVASGAEEAWRALHLADLAQEAVLEQEPAFPPPTAEEPPPQDRVEIVSQGMNWVRLKVAAKSPALLLLADAWYPGWRARVNGEEVPVLRADYFLRALALGAGEQEVVFRYDPPWLSWASWVSLGSLGLWLILSVWPGPGRGRRP